jgi:hypothetical protein
MLVSEAMRASFAGLRKGGLGVGREMVRLATPFPHCCFSDAADVAAVTTVAEPDAAAAADVRRLRRDDESARRCCEKGVFAT